MRALAWLSIAAGVVVSVLLALASVLLVSCAEGEPVERGSLCAFTDDCEMPMGALELLVALEEVSGKRRAA